MKIFLSKMKMGNLERERPIAPAYEYSNLGNNWTFSHGTGKELPGRKFTLTRIQLKYVLRSEGWKYLALLVRIPVGHAITMTTNRIGLSKNYKKEGE